MLNGFASYVIKLSGRRITRCMKYEGDLDLKLAISFNTSKTRISFLSH